MAHLQISELIPAPRLDVYAYMTDISNLQSLLKGVIDVRVVTPEVPLKRGNEIHLVMTRYGLSQTVRLRIEDVLRGSRLTYRQSEGSFASWTHTMKFTEHAPGETLVTDLVDYQVPMGLFGHLADDLFVKKDMSRVLQHRLQRARDYFI